MFLRRMQQWGSSRSVQQFSSFSAISQPHDWQNFMPTSLSTCMCRQMPLASDLSAKSFSRAVIIWRPMPYLRQGSRTPKVRIQACFWSLQSSSLTVQAPMTMSLQQAYLEKSVYWVAILMQSPVEYLTGKVSKLSFRSRLMFLSLMSPIVIGSVFFFPSAIIIINSNMSTYADISRTFATAVVVALLGLLCVSRWSHWEGVGCGLVGSYQHLRMLLLKCGWVLPHSKEIEVEGALYFDLACELTAAVFILMGRRIGGKMMAAWYVFKMVLLFGGYLILRRYCL